MWPYPIVIQNFTLGSDQKFLTVDENAAIAILNEDFQPMKVIFRQCQQRYRNLCQQIERRKIRTDAEIKCRDNSSRGSNSRKATPD